MFEIRFRQFYFGKPRDVIGNVAIQINAPFERIFPLASEVERWPERLPHYRYVRRLPSLNGERRFAMGARRGPIPVTLRRAARFNCDNLA